MQGHCQFKGAVVPDAVCSSPRFNCNKVECLVCAGGLLTEVIGLHGKIAMNVILFMRVQEKKKKTSGQGECINVHRHRGSAIFEKLKRLQGYSSQGDLASQLQSLD